MTENELLTRYRALLEDVLALPFDADQYKTPTLKSLYALQGRIGRMLYDIDHARSLESVVIWDDLFPLEGAPLTPEERRLRHARYTAAQLPQTSSLLR